ncbi:hypothetical protein IJM86_03710 [bacterium]|nr:hypothetical protein [bacterium]
MSFEPNLQTQTQNPNNSQVQTSTDSVKGTGSKGMVIAFLALLPVVGVVIYFMMPDLFAPITEPQIPVQQEMQLPKDNSEIDEENEMKEDDEVDSEHGSAEEDEEKGEEKSE